MSNSKPNITLEQSLQAYRVMNTPTQYSWKQHWAQEQFDTNDMLELDTFDRKQFNKRLLECDISIMPAITATSGEKKTLKDLIDILIDPNNKIRNIHCICNIFTHCFSNLNTICITSISITTITDYSLSITVRNMLLCNCKRSTLN